MRGLPPAPSNVVRLEFDFFVTGRTLTTGMWLLIPDVETGGVPYLDALCADAQFYLLGGFTGCMHNGASLVTCRASYGGTTPANFVSYAAPNHGAYSGGQADAIACGVYAVSATGGKGSGSRLRIPGTPDDFVDDGYRLSSAGVSQLIALCGDINNFVTATHGPLGAQAVLGTVQKARRGAPLPSAQFDPAQAIVPSYRIEYLRRRMPRSRWVSPI